MLVAIEVAEENLLSVDIISSDHGDGGGVGGRNSSIKKQQFHILQLRDDTVREIFILDIASFFFHEYSDRYSAMTVNFHLVLTCIVLHTCYLTRLYDMVNNIQGGGDIVPR